MNLVKLTGIASVVGLAGAATAFSRFRRELREIEAALEMGSDIVDTERGPIEFACEGRGPPVLMIHGAGGGYDQGLSVGREFFGPDYRVIAPSRFGYLRTPLPEDSSPAAQADAHEKLLDRLEIEDCVVAGVSAGAPSAIEMALRHPERVSALILFVPRAYDPEMIVGVQPSVPNQIVLRLMERASDFGYWLAMRLARSTLVRFLGVPPRLEEKAAQPDRQRVSDIMRSILPLSKRAAGIRADSATVLSEWPLERIKVPTLIVTAKDDLFQTLPGSSFTAERIEGAQLKVLETGGHLMLGGGDDVREAVADFLGRLQPVRRAA